MPANGMIGLPLLKSLVKTFGLPDDTCRVVIDISVRDAVRVYSESIAGQSALGDALQRISESAKGDGYTWTSV